MLLSLYRRALVVPTIAFNLLVLSECFGQFINANNLQGVSVVNGATATFGTGVSVCDFDGDGLDDISFGTKSTPPFLFRNTGSGFVQVPFTHPSPDKAIKSIIWVDIDNDGDRDLFLSYEFDSVRLYENIGDLELVDITLQSGLLMEFNIRNAGASFGDYDNDGDLDLYLCKYYNSGAFQGPTYENILYRNNGDKTFTNVTYAANASVGVNASFNPVWWDYNEDGWVDLYIVNDRLFNQNYLLRNQGDGSFQDVSAGAGVNHFIDAMGCALGDYNNDLLIDFFVANSEYDGNYLYQKQVDNTFHEVGLEAGVRMYALCWSGLWMDYDNNGWLDLHVGAEINQIGQMAPNHLYQNNGDGSFQNITQAAGLTNDHFSTFSTAGGDWNNDGYPDFICSNGPPSPSLLWQNIGGDHNYLAVTLEGTLSNRDAVGATIYAYANDLHQVRYVTCSENHIAQNSFRKLFGLANHSSIDSLVIKWPLGLEERYYNLDVNSTHHFVEGASLSAVVEAEQLHFCEGQAVALNASLDVPVLWSTGEFAIGISVSQPGEYWYTMQTPQGFSLQSDTVSVTTVPLSSFQFEVNQISCFGANDGEIVISNSWGSFPVSISINGNSGSYINQSLTPGDYEISIVDNFGCALSQVFELTEPDALQTIVVTESIDCFGSVTPAQTFVFGGTPPYTFDWGEQNPLQLPAGSHSISVTDANGCVQTSILDIVQPEELTVDIVHTGNNLEAFVSGGTPPFNYFWVTPSGATATESSISTDLNGFYSLTLTDANSCLVNSVVPINVTAIADNDKNGVSIYPIPAIHSIKVSSNHEWIREVLLIDLTGRTVIHYVFEPHQFVQIDLNGCTQGNYIAEIILQSGESIRKRVAIAR